MQNDVTYEDAKQTYVAWARLHPYADVREFLRQHLFSDEIQQQLLVSERGPREPSHSTLTSQQAAPADVPTTRPISGVESDIEEGNLKILGPYRLLQKIGSGGQGTVWLAEQSKPIKRRVALKLLHKKLERSEQILARFEMERQALAVMDHPNIARVIDAGTAMDGAPFFVMDWVQGIPLVKYCDQHKRTVPERLELFLSVLSAVQHAHQKGIVHRDLKPSNILVQIIDGQPVAKVIDFGLAKATEAQQLMTFTDFHQIVGTIQYMSPEQASSDPLSVDSRSDIYSLGILLYELLVGSTPIERRFLKERGQNQALAQIGVDPAPRPSVRLSSSQDSIRPICQKRQIEPEKLRTILRNDLDWIVTKALRLDRSERYQNATSFADDIQRFLGGEPVRARPKNRFYTMAKFVHRNKALTGASILAVLGLLSATALALIYADFAHESAESQKTVAQRAERKQKEADMKSAEADKLSNENKIIAQQLATKIQQAVNGAVESGRRAWELGQPQEAIAHFLQANRLDSSNQAALDWLYFALVNHNSSGWSPPLRVFGGSADTNLALKSQDGRWVVTQTTDLQVHIWDVQQDEITYCCNEVTGSLEDVYSTESALQILTFSAEDSEFSVWQLKHSNGHFTKLTTLKDSAGRGELAFSPGGKYLVSRVQNNVWFSVADGYKNVFDSGGVLQFTADDSALVNAFDHYFRVLNPESGEELWSARLPHVIVPANGKFDVPAKLSSAESTYFDFDASETVRFTAFHPGGRICTTINSKTGEYWMRNFAGPTTPGIQNRGIFWNQNQFLTIDQVQQGQETPIGCAGCGTGVAGTVSHEIKTGSEKKSKISLGTKTSPWSEQIYNAKILDRSQVVLSGHPIQSPSIQLLDFNSTSAFVGNTPLYLPPVEFPPNRANPIPTADNTLISEVARNAIGVWNRPAVEPIQFPRIPLSPKEYSVGQRMLSITKFRTETKSRLEDQLGKEIEVTYQVNVPYTESIEINRSIQLVDSRSANGGIGTFSQIIERPLDLDILDPQSLKKVASMKLKFSKPIENISLHFGSGLLADCIVVEGKLGQSESKGWISEIGIFDIQSRRWLLQNWIGKFASFVPGTQQLLLISEDQSLHLLDCSSQTERITQVNFVAAGAIDAAVCPERKRLACLYADSVRVWKLEKGTDWSGSEASELAPFLNLGGDVVFDKNFGWIQFNASGERLIISVDAHDVFYKNCGNCAATLNTGVVYSAPADAPPAPAPTPDPTPDSAPEPPESDQSGENVKSVLDDEPKEKKQEKKAEEIESTDSDETEQDGKSQVIATASEPVNVVDPVSDQAPMNDSASTYKLEGFSWRVGDVKRLQILNLEDQTRLWLRDVQGPFASKKFVRFEDGDGIKLLSAEKGDVQLGPFADPGTRFYFSENEDYVAIVSQIDRKKIEVWKTEIESPKDQIGNPPRPIAPAVHIAPDAQIVSCIFLEDSLRVFYQDPSSKPYLLDIPMQKGVSVIDGQSLAWIEAYVGQKIVNGRANAIAFSERCEQLRKATPQATEWGELIQWLQQPTARRSVWPPAVMEACFR